MKLIKYQLMTEVNHGTEEEPNIVQTFNACEILCNDSNFEANLAIAEAEAYNGEVTVEEVEDEETSQTDAASVWDELDAAYQEGVDSV